MARHVIVRTPYPTAEEVADSLNLSKKSRKMIADLVARVNFSKNEKTGEIDVVVSRKSAGARKIRAGA